jgi:hypothetical protein
VRAETLDRDKQRQSANGHVHRPHLRLAAPHVGRAGAEISSTTPDAAIA